MTISSIGSLSLSVSNCADNGGGLIRVTTSIAHGLSAGQGINISDVTGTTEANGSWPAITVIDTTNFDLDGSTFSNAYVSGGSVGRDYATPALWWVDVDVSASDYIGEMYNDSEIETTSQTDLTGTDGTASFNAILRPAAGEGFADHADKLTNPLRYNASVGVGIRKTNSFNIALNIDSNYFELEGIQVKADATISVTMQGTNTSIKDCILHATTGVHSTDIREGCKVINTVIIQEGNGEGADAWGSPEFHNCTLIGLGTNTTGIDQKYTTGTVVKNCGIFGWTTPLEAGTWGAGTDYNATDAATINGGGSNNVTSLTTSDQFENVASAATLDLRAVSTGSLDENGVRDQANTNDLDIIGQARSTTTPTIGAWEVVGEILLPNKLIIPLSDNIVSFIGKKINSGSVVTRAGSASLTNSGKEGLNALLAAIAGPQALKVLGQKGTAGAAIISQILDDQEVSAAGKSGLNGAIDQTLSDLVLAALGQKGTTGAIATSLDLIVSLLGFESQVIFSGVIDSSLGDNALSTIGNTGATGSVSAQLGNLVALLTGAAGHTGDMSVNILTGVELLAKIGVTGVMDIQLLDNEVQMIEITVSDKIYQILISTKTGQIKILAPKTGSIDISTQQ